MNVPAVVQPAPVPATVSRARRRAVIFVPGLKRRERNQQRDALVENLLLNEDVPLRRSASDGDEIKIAGTAGVRLKAARTGAETDPPAPGEIDIFEAYWGDQLPVDAEQQPLRRMTRGLALLRYWFVSPMWDAFSSTSWQIPAGLLLGGGALVLWYLSLLATFAGQWLDPASDLTAQAKQLISFAPWLADWLATTIAYVASWRIWPLISLLLPITPIMVIVDHAQAVRLLLTNAMDERGIGRRARVRKAVADVLSAAAEARTSDGEPAYSEIVIVGHSFGTIILIDVLADWPYEAELAKLSVVTLGSPQSVLARRSSWLKEETRRLMQERRVSAWTDISGEDDYLSAPIDGHKAAYGAACALTLSLEQSGLPFSTSAHDAYLASYEVLRLIVR